MLHQTIRLLALACLFVLLVTAATAQTKFTTQTYATGAAPAGVVSGDFNRDGNVDLAVVDNQANRVTILLGVGGGQFAFGSDFATGPNPTQIITADFDRDGTLDLMIVNSDQSITVLLGNGDGTFRPGPQFTFSIAVKAIVAGDWDHDGAPDLAIVGCDAGNAENCVLLFSRNNGQGIFTLTQGFSIGFANCAGSCLISDDFNIDGSEDVAVGANGKVSIFLNNGHGTFSLHTTVTPPNTSAVASLFSSRLNHDSAPDLLVRVFDNVNDTDFPNSIYSFLGNGKGDFFLKTHIPVGNFGGIVLAADLNGDHIDDLITVGDNFRNGTLQFALGHGDGTFGALQTISNNVDTSEGGILVRDLNGDSRHDIVATALGPLGGPGDTFVFLNTNAGTNCAPPGSANLSVHICSPGANSTVGTTMTVRASGNSPVGVKRVELWVDGAKRAQNFSDQLFATISVSPHASHQVTVVAVDQYDALAKKTITVHVP